MARRSLAASWSPLHRPLWVALHRWAGLTLALFLVVAGATGAILPFEETLNLASRPGLSRAAPPRAGAMPLDAVTIAERVERATGATIAYLPLDVPRDRVMRLFLAARADAPPLRHDVVWADPYTGRIRLAYTFGGVRDGPENIVPFLYQLHYGYVAGAWGMWTFGVAALVWTIDCFIGFGLTLPSARNGMRARSPVRTWLARWRPAWRIRRARGYKLTFDLHRASGLWLWPVLLAFAWSGVALALPSVAMPAARLAGGEAAYAPPARAAALATPPVGRRAAIAAGTAALARIAREQGFTTGRPTALGYDPATGTYTLYARTSLDPAGGQGRTQVWIDGTSGRAIHFADPLGTATADRVTTWLTLLHMAQLFGPADRVFTSCVGLLVCALSITGVLIWSRKRWAHRSVARASRVRRRREGASRRRNRPSAVPSGEGIA